MMSMINDELNSHKEVIEKTIETMQANIYTACIIATETLKKNNKIFIFGNSTNAIIAQNIAKKFNDASCSIHRYCLSAFALTEDIAVLTDIANNYGYDRVFDKQVEVYAGEEDLLIGISTSGNSKNVLRALSLGQNLGCKTIGFSGGNGGAMDQFCDINLVVPSFNEQRTQEVFNLVGYIISLAIKQEI